MIKEEQKIAAIKNQVNFVLVGIVTKVLPDEEIKNSPHQRFVVAQENGATVLVTINLDKAPRLEATEGDRIEARGEYVWDTRGGYVHQLYDQGWVKKTASQAVKYPRCYAANKLFTNHNSNRYIEIEGRVYKILTEDTDRTPHQKFLVKTDLDQSIMVVVNLDHMMRINLEIGDYVEIAGIYVWNEYGGLIHITHHDHFGTHPDGWIYVPRLGKVFE